MNTAAKQASAPALAAEEDAQTKKKSKRRRKGRDADAPGQEGRPRKRGRIIKLVVLFLLVCFLGGFLFASIRYDLFSVRTKFIGMVNRLDPSFVSATEEELSKLHTDQDQLALDQAKLSLDRDNLDAREAQLDVREEQVETREFERIPIHRRPLTDDKRDELTHLGKIYNNMEPEAAAEIITELYGVTDMATLLYFMNQARAAEVMSFMDPALAASITEELMWD